MKKTATLIALAGLSMAAKTEHSFLGRKPVEIKPEIDPKMVIKPAHDIDPGMVRKPNKNIDQGIFVKPKNPQGTISADDDELLVVYKPLYDVDPKMVIRPRDDIDPKMVIKPRKTQGTILTADDNDDELLLIYRPADNIDPGMVRRPPFGSEIDPKFIIKPPRDLDRGIFVRPGVRTGTVYVDDEMRLVSGTEVDPGMVIKPKRGDIDPGMIRKPVKGWEIDPKIFVKPKRGDVLYADDDEMMVRRPPSENIKYLDAENDDELVYAGSRFDPEQAIWRRPYKDIDRAIIRKPDGTVRFFDAENDDELAVLGHVREPRLIGDFPTKPWPGQPVYADAEDDELHIGVSDQGIPNGKSHDDELMIQRSPFAVSDLGIPARPMSHLRAHDDELAEMTDFVREPRVIGDHGKSADDADDELVYASARIDPGMVRRPPQENIDQGIWKRPMGNIRYFDAENDDELAVITEKAKHVREPRLIGDFPTKPWPGMPVYADDELAYVANKTKPVREPRLIGDFYTKPWPGQPVYADAEDDELIMFADHSLDRPRRGVFDPKELTKPWYQHQTMYADDADNELLWYKKGTEKKDKTPIKEADDANDDELIMFADKSLDARLERRKVPFDIKELTKPWYQQQTMYADDSLVALGELLEDN